MENEKEKIREKVSTAWETLCLYEETLGVDSESVRHQLIIWKTLDALWNDLYDEECGFYL
jgi:hypothetical protein